MNHSRVTSRTAWILVVVLTSILGGITYSEASRRYDRFETGWSWDLAYYNQWYWAVAFGDQVLSVRPIAAYADEGPSVWKTNYVSPLRYALIPLYTVVPGPRTLLAVHAALFWLIVPAAFTLVRSETKSTGIALLAAFLVPSTPLLWPLAFNDFREIQLAIPFVLWGIQGVRARDLRVSLLGVAGMLACRQEMAVVVASLALLRSNEPEDVADRFRWRHTLLMTGLIWIFLVFFGHLRYWGGTHTPLSYLEQFGGGGSLLDQTLATGAEILAVGLGSWLLFWVLAPREVLMTAPWLWSLSHGKWAVRLLASEEWHHVRYATPIVAIGLASGLIGFGRFSVWLLRGRANPGKLIAIAVVLATLSGLALVDLQNMARRRPRPISRSEAAKLWKAIGEVKSEDGVLAAYEVAAPLSSRNSLFSYILPVNRPRGYPELAPEISWVFYRNQDGLTEVFEKQGFKVVERGRFITILHRDQKEF